ncbi:MAG: antibiotic biosynthesis monooxygenase family protein [Pseudomonadota bacterium]
MTIAYQDDSNIVTVSHVIPKPGQFDTFIDIQRRFQERMAGKIPGLLGGRLLRAEDGKSLIIMARFENRDDLENWKKSDLFAGHLARVRPLIEPASPGLFQAIWRSGEV